MSPNQRSPDEIIAEDRRRDPRNAERRKIIKRQTSERRDSLVDSLWTAKNIIDGHSKNRHFETKASERRRVIKHCCGTEPDSVPNGRRMSFADELVIARLVVTPEWDYKQSVERSKEKCRAVKEQFASTGKRRPSLQEEIGVAKELIVDKEREKRSLPPEIVAEVVLCFLLGGKKRMSFFVYIMNEILRLLLILRSTVINQSIVYLPT